MTWKGDAILERMKRAQEKAIDETMADCVGFARPRVPVQTGLSRGSIGIVQKAQRRSDGSVYGLWGAPALPPSEGYTSSSRVRVFFLEVGFRGKSGLHFLRGAADRHYGSLRRRIAANFVRGGR